MKENTNPLLWYVCKFCRRAFQQPRDLIQHKKAEHLDRMLADKKVKKFEKNNAASISSRAVALDRSEDSEESAESTDDVGGDTAAAKNAGIDAKRDEDSGGHTESTEDIRKQTEKNKKVEEKTESTEEINDKNTEGTDSSNSSVTSENEPSHSDPSLSSTSENSSESEKEDRKLETPENSESSKSTCTGGDENSGQIDSDDTSSSLDEFQTFKCQTCSKTYASERARAVHMKLMHTEENSYRCKYCSKTCTAKGYLAQHVRFMHSKENSYPCKHCSMSFSYAMSRRCHVANEHADELHNKSALSGRSSRKRVAQKVQDSCAKDRKRPKTLGKPVSNSSPDEADNDCSSSTKTSAAVPRKDASSTSNAYNCPFCKKRFQSKRKYQLHQSYHRRNPTDKEESVSDLDETLPIEFSGRSKKSTLGSKRKTAGNCE